MTDFYLPSDGSVLIVDDKPEEALPLIQLLSSKGIASTYYSGNNDDDLPELPVQKVRLAFFDIQLYGASSAHNYAQTILRLLERLIPKDNGPYVLILWSGRLEDNADVVESQVTSVKSARKPLCVIRLEKSTFFESIADDSDQDSLVEDVCNDLETAFNSDDIERIRSTIKDNAVIREYNQPVADAINNITKELNKQLKENIDIFQIFTIWEAIISKASGETVENYAGLHPSDDYWSDNFKTSIFRMAHAYLGTNTKNLEQDEILRNAIKVINNTFLDVAENHCQAITDLSENVNLDKNKVQFSKNLNDNLYTLNWIIKTNKYQLYIDGKNKTRNGPMAFKSISKQGGSKEQNEKIQLFLNGFSSIKPRINTRLLIDMNLPDHVQPGNTYEKNVPHWARRKSLLKNYYNAEILFSNSEINRFKFIELEVTPVCDYAQNKWKKYRLLPGLMIPEEHAESLATSDNLYTEIPIVQIDDKNYKIVFDFKFLKSVDQKGYLEENPIFRVRNDLFASILSRLSSHASRIGLALLD